MPLTAKALPHSFEVMRSPPSPRRPAARLGIDAVALQNLGRALAAAHAGLGAVLPRPVRVVLEPAGDLGVPIRIRRNEAHRRRLAQLDARGSLLVAVFLPALAPRHETGAPVGRVGTGAGVVGVEGDELRVDILVDHAELGLDLIAKLVVWRPVLGKLLAERFQPGRCDLLQNLI